MSRIATTRPSTIAAPAEGAPAWVDTLWFALVAYAVICTVCMLTGLGGPRVRHYIGLLSDAPSNLAAAVIAATVARRVARGPLQIAWRWLSASLFLYLIGSVICMGSWLSGIDPFPGPADIFFCAFFRH